ncbi:hypothetical protein FRC12_014917 [Ceratobasidium sp. 428]|nr:hypothetical protein FRC12_014917 [Ceratobasidium sp. 428]
MVLDIDLRSLGAAAANLEQNPVIAERVQLLPGTQDGPILFPLLPETLAQTCIGSEPERPCVTFSMCNPPFYSDIEDVSRSADNKELDPHAICTGASVEMITPGGEVNFVRRMLDESIMLQDVCWWYTSLLGKMSSLVAVTAAIKEHGINNYVISELVQGNTRRWIIAWSFLDVRLPDALARPTSQSLKSIAPPPNTLCHTLPAARTLSYQTLLSILGDIPKVRTEELRGPERVRVTAHEVTWTRAARRRLARGSIDGGNATTGALPLILVSEISVVDEHILEVQWIRGRDRGVFESFWGHLSGRLN